MRALFLDEDTRIYDMGYWLTGPKVWPRPKSPDQNLAATPMTWRCLLLRKRPLQVGCLPVNKRLTHTGTTLLRKHPAPFVIKLMHTNFEYPVQCTCTSAAGVEASW